MEVPRIQPATSWLEVSHADPLTNDRIITINEIVIVIEVNFGMLPTWVTTGMRKKGIEWVNREGWKGKIRI